MSQKYYALVTDKGLTKLRAAAQGVGALTLSHMAFGDGNGSETAPGTSATALVGERYRTSLSDKRPHPSNPSILYVEAIIPPGIGGWTLREAGIYDSDGDLIVIAKTPSMDVALLSEGASTEGLVRLPLVFESAQDVEFLIDPTVLLATQAWVIERIISRPFVTVESITATAPPAVPASHALYVVPTGATGAWAGKTHQMAYWHGSWLFAAAPVAKVVGTSDTGKYWRRTATGWVEFTGSETEPGFTQFATVAEHKAGALTSKATHPAGVATNVQSGTWSYAVASGTANALTASLTPALEAYTPGLEIRFVPSAVNTDSATLKVGSLAALPIVRNGGYPLRAGDLKAGRLSIGHVSADATVIELVANNQDIPPPGSGLTGSQNYIGWSPAAAASRDLTATFTAPSTGLVLAISTLNKSVLSTENRNVVNTIYINGVQGPGDGVNSGSTVIMTTTATPGQPFTIISRITVDAGGSSAMSNYLTYLFIPA